MFGSLDTSASALNAQRIRLETIASNVACMDAAGTTDGRIQPYRRLYPIFEPQRTADGGEGVHVSRIAQDHSPFDLRIEPGSDLADPQGYVAYPNIDLSTEMTNAIEATRAYEANITAIETTKSMISSTLRILA